MNKRDNIIDLEDRFAGHTKYFDDNGGGGDMSGFVTHRELDLTKESIANKIDANGNELKGKIEINAEKLNSQKEAINKQSDRLDKIILLVITSIIIPILMKIFFP